MMINKKSWRLGWQQLRRKYRVQIISEDHFEEKASLRLSLFNLLVVFASVIIAMVSLTIYLVAFTNLREYIPGYADSSSKKKLLELLIITDSLEKKSAANDVFLNNLQLVIQGKNIPDSLMYKRDTTSRFSHITDQRSKDDSILRAMVESEDQYNLSAITVNKNTLASSLFFTPLRGTITNHFNADIGHYGIDVASRKNEAVKATLPGTVIMSAWTSESGYVLVIQHTDNLVSVYKHNAVLLKKSGAIVKSGEPIAIVGNSGENTTGPHLHFELWYNGIPVDPTLYMVF
ncbi:MAG: M23 family metallopeptidase [Flavobacteriales bacterium]|nr:M23 family metallopeptidase [Flavobacteriales bacterium]